jgi:hypothetical protein
MATYYQIRAGQIIAEPITGKRLPVQVTPDTEIDALNGEAKEHPDFASWTLPAILKIATRVVPWVTWHIAPNFADWDQGRDLGGCAYTAYDSIVVLSYFPARQSVGLALHEAWHCIEAALTRQELETVTEAVRPGPRWPGENGLLIERRALAFENWAMSRLEAPVKPRDGKLGRMMDAVHRRCMPSHERVFLDVFTGRVATRAAKRRQVASHRLPSETIQRAELDRASDKRGWGDRAVEGWLSLSNAVFG